MRRSSGARQRSDDADPGTAESAALARLLLARRRVHQQLEMFKRRFLKTPNIFPQNLTNHVTALATSTCGRRGRGQRWEMGLFSWFYWDRGDNDWFFWVDTPLSRVLRCEQT